MKTLLLVDGNALLHRAYHALPVFKTSKGTPTNAVYGFITMLLKTKDSFKPTHIAVCFDRPEPTFRNKLYKEYQIQRPKVDDDLIVQFPVVRDFLDAAKIARLEKPGFEADDLIGTVSTKAKKAKFKILILTADKDILQLINGATAVISPHKGLTELKMYDEVEARDRLGVKPSQVADFKALMGDQSDNYKGIPGIGPKTAANLLNNFISLENIYKNINKITNEKIKNMLIAHKKDALMSKKLATIVTDVKIDLDLESCKFESYNENLKAFFEKMEFKSLVKRYFAPKNDEGQNKENNDEKEQLGLF